jgi:hypothetical protein
MTGEDKTCEVCPEHRRAIALVHEDFSPEAQQWLCWQCFEEHKDHITVIEYINADEHFNDLHSDSEYWQRIKARKRKRDRMKLYLCSICGRWELLNEETEILCQVDEDHGVMSVVEDSDRIFVQFPEVVDVMGKTPHRDAKIKPYEELVRQV